MNTITHYKDPTGCGFTASAFLALLLLVASLFGTSCSLSEFADEVTLQGESAADAVDDAADRIVAAQGRTTTAVDGLAAENNQNSQAERAAADRRAAELAAAFAAQDAADAGNSDPDPDPDPDAGLQCNGPSALGQFGYVQKPISDGDGNLVFLWPAQYQNILSATIIKANGDVLERGNYVGRTNGNRATVRFSMPGCGYLSAFNSGGLRIVTSPTETCTELGTPCVRHE